MPADLGIQTELDEFKATTGGATTFAARLITLLDAVLGTNNPFGTAAFRMAGTALNNLPQLGNDGRLSQTTMPQASSGVLGAVRVAPTLSSQIDGAVAIASQAKAAIDAIETGLQASSFTLEDMTTDPSFVTANAGFIIASGGGGGGGSLGGDGSGGGSVSIRYGDIANATPAMVAPGGFGGRGPTLQGIQWDTNTAGFEILALTPSAASAPSFAFLLRAAGSRGGRGAYNSTTVAQTGTPGDRLIALVGNNGGTFAVTGAANSGGAGGSAGSNGEAGANGYAKFLRIS